MCGGVSADDDGDGLIEICSLSGLDAVRWALDGTAYKPAAAAAANTRGCPSTGCRGYELVADLDFNNPLGYVAPEAGWRPLGHTINSTGSPTDTLRFSGIFEGNGHRISNLNITTSSGGLAKTTAALQTPISATGIYANWQCADWDFGTASQYPVLKYTRFKYARVPGDIRSCRRASDAATLATHLPLCGTLLTPALRHGFSRLTLAECTMPRHTGQIG